MSRNASTFRKNDMTCTVKGVVAAGVKIVSVETDKRGKLILIAENGARQAVQETEQGA
jgi:hypothetical protein